MKAPWVKVFYIISQEGTTFYKGIIPTNSWQNFREFFVMSQNIIHLKRLDSMFFRKWCDVPY